MCQATHQHHTPSCDGVCCHGVTKAHAEAHLEAGDKVDSFVAPSSPIVQRFAPLHHNAWRQCIPALVIAAATRRRVHDSPALWQEAPEGLVGVLIEFGLLLKGLPREKELSSVLLPRVHILCDLHHCLTCKHHIYQEFSWVSRGINPTSTAQGAP